MAGSLAVIAVASFAAGVRAQGRTTVRGQPDGWRWPDTLDSVNAAPGNHKILFENDHVRLLEVTVQPGETEKMHGHKYPSVFMMDAPQPRTMNRDLEADGSASDRPRGGKGQPRPSPGATEGQYPTCRAMTTPQAPHQVTIADSFPQHFYRMEFKKIDGESIGTMAKYPAD